MAKTLSIITGGSTGIGAALARNLLRSGPVLNVSRNALSLGDAKPIYPLYQLALDLTEPDGAAEALHRWLSQRPDLKVGLFVSAAAQLSIGNLERTATASVEQTLRLNAWAPIVLTQTLLRGGHLQWGKARFIFVTSSLARSVDALSFARLGLYSASKAALERLVQVQRREMKLARYQVGSTIVHPGIVDTSMQSILRSDIQSDPTFREKTAGLPAYAEGDWTDCSPASKPRTISAQQSADFLAWIATLPDDRLESYYDYYACEVFHTEATLGGREAGQAAVRTDRW